MYNALPMAFILAFTLSLAARVRCKSRSTSSSVDILNFYLVLSVQETQLKNERDCSKSVGDLNLLTNEIAPFENRPITLLVIRF